MKDVRRVCLVLMPFGKDWSPRFYSAIKNVFERDEFRSDWRVERPDEDPKVGALMAGVRRLIEDATLIVADLTEANPNVMYEVGAAHEQRKVVILTCQQDAHDGVPVDVHAELRIDYSIKALPRLEDDLADTVQGLVKRGQLGEAREFWRGTAKQTEISVPWTLCERPEGSRQHVTPEAAQALVSVMGSFAPAVYPDGRRPKLVLPDRNGGDADASDPQNPTNHIAIGGPVSNYAVRRMRGTELATPAYFRGPGDGQESAGLAEEPDQHDLLWQIAPGEPPRMLESGTRERSDDPRRTCIISRVVRGGRSVFTVQGVHAPVTLWAVRASLADEFWRAVFERCDCLRAYVFDRQASCCLVARMPEADPSANLRPERVEIAFGQKRDQPGWTRLAVENA